MKIAWMMLVMLFGGCQKACDQKNSDKGVFFITPNNNDNVSSPITVTFGVKGMSVRPALEDVNDQTSGHHHILIDHPQGFIPKGVVIPKDAKHIHYGGGETVGTITLSPGKHTLSMQFADGAHISYGKEMATTIVVEVVK